jgi:hypothetical protein
MRSLFVLAFAVLGVGAQEVPPNPAPPTAAREGRIITKLDDQKKSDKTHQADSKSLPEAPCNQCLNHCSVGQPHVKTKEEQAKEDSLDLLSRRSMRAAIIGSLEDSLELQSLSGKPFLPGPPPMLRR